MGKKLDKIFKSSRRLEIDDSSKIVIMSDCHRGTVDNYENFIRNKNIYLIALLHYYNRGFTYIELGDGDEMWGALNYEDIVDAHLDVFKQLKKFYDLGRLVMIYGNHDMDIKYRSLLEKYFYKYYDEKMKQDESLLDGLMVEESLVLDYKDYDIFLVHGHQIDFFNGTLWRFSCFLVRNVWSFLKRIGIMDPTSAAKNSKVANWTEKKLRKWSKKNNKILISGHTYRPIYPKTRESLYFNDDSCVHPNGITCLEIENGKISLVRWEFKVNENKLLSIERYVLDGDDLIEYFYK